ncbi:MarR family transcriptional regulator [Rhizobium etli]|uniref:MarR family transcriptional regulator n=1 Tax=Rhizobium etli TaxID=29449 RepID=UPI00163F2749|nr:MarR family transcriptional regulator [Rhizobium sp. IE4771]
MNRIPKMSIYPLMSLNAIDGMTGVSAPIDGIERLEQILAAVPVTLGLPQLQAIVAVGASPGLSVNELAERLNVPQQTASRYVAQLMGRYQEVGENDVLQPIVEQRVSLSDPRKRALYLTWHGRTMIAKLIAVGWKN